MKIKLLLFFIWALIFPALRASSFHPESKTAVNQIDYGVQSISRLLPSGLWDSWTFRDIFYNADTNTVYWVIQWNRRIKNNEQPSADEIQKTTRFIVENVMKGYDDVIKNSTIVGDGDYMLYLALGILLKKMEQDKTSLEIILLKRNDECLVNKGEPMKLDYTQLKEFVK